MVNRLADEMHRAVSHRELGTTGMLRLETAVRIPIAVGMTVVPAWGVGLCMAGIVIDRSYRIVHPLPMRVVPTVVHR